MIGAAARPFPYERSRLRVARSGGLARCVAVAALLGAVGLSCANGFIDGVVAYERDTSVFYYPLFEWASQQIHSGQFPLWCPQILGGYPLFADGELGLASPLVLLAMYLLPPDVAFVVLRLVFIGVAAFGAYALARAWRLPRTASVVAGITFSLGSFLPAHIQHENVVRTAAWLPLTLACVEHAVRQVGRTRRRWAIAGAASMGLAAVGLHPEILLVNLLTLAVYGALRCWKAFPGSRVAVSDARHVVAIVASVALTGLALAAAQLVPLAELGPLSARAGSFPYSDVAGQSFTPFGLVQLVLPYVFRGPGHQQWGLWTHWESYLYVGLAPLVLATVAIAHWRRRAIALWLVIGALALLVSMGQYTPLDLFWLLWRIPGLGWLRAPGRFELAVVLALAMLAAHGMAILQASARTPRCRRALPMRLAPTLLIVSTPFIFAFGLSRAHSALLDQHDRTVHLIQARYLSLPHDQPALTADNVYAGLLRTTDLTDPRVAGAVLGLFVTLTTIALWQRAPSAQLRRWSGWPAALILFSAVDLLAFGWAIHPRQALSILATPDAAITSVKDVLLSQDASGAPPRVLASPVVQQIAPDRLVPLGIQEAGGYSSLDTSRERSLLLRVERVDDDLLDLLNIKYVLDPGVYGPLPSYRDVQYSPRNPLLDAGSGSDMSDEIFSVSPPAALTEIRVISALEGGGDVDQATPVAEVALRTQTGEVVAHATLRAGEQVMDWGWDDLARSNNVRHNRVEVAGEIADKLADGEVARRILSFAYFRVPAAAPIETVEITSLAARGRVAIYGVGLVDSTGVVQQLFGRHKTKYLEIMRDQTVRVLENTAAYPRAFVVQGARLAPPGGSLEIMQTQHFAPRTEVILAADTQPANLNAAMLPLEPHAPAVPDSSAQITRYSSLEVDVNEASSSSGFLVLTDAFYPGWHAFVDGRRWPILRGDVMFRVVELPPGEHSVVFRFEPTSVRIGVAISVAALLGCLAFLLVDVRRA